jgi:phytoene synthase
MLAALREADIDRYLSLLLMPDGVRNDLLALCLFNAEIAAIRDRIREALPGEVRLQWWRDVLSGERNSEAQAHPVASAIVRGDRAPRNASRSADCHVRRAGVRSL